MKVDELQGVELQLKTLKKQIEKVERATFVTLRSDATEALKQVCCILETLHNETLHNKEGKHG